MKKTSILILLIIIATITIQPHVQAETPHLTASPSSFYLIYGTDGDNVHIYYYGRITNIPNGTNTCQITSTNTREGYGFKPIVYSKDCSISSDGETAYVSIWVKFNGTYRGAEGPYSPITSVRVSFYDSFSRKISDEYIYWIDSVYINRVDIKEVHFYPDYDKIQYSTTPQNPRYGDTIKVIESSPATMTIILTNAPTVSASFPFEIDQGETKQTGTVFLSSYSIYDTKNINNILLSEPIYYRITSSDNLLTIASGSQEVETFEKTIPLEMTVTHPYFRIDPDKPNQKVGIITVPISIDTLDGTVDIHVTVKTSSGRTMTIDKSYSKETVDFIDVKNINKGDTVTVITKIEYKGAYGTQTVELKDEFKAEIVTFGKVLVYMFSYIIVLLMGAGAVASAFGLFLRRPELMTGGIIAMGMVSLVVMIPTLMGYVLTLAQLSSPSLTHLDYTDLTLFNLGEKMDNALEYTVSIGTDNAHKLNLLGGTLFTIAVVLLAGSMILGGGLGAIAKIIAGGASSGLTAVAKNLLVMAFLSYFSGALLDLLSRIYPIAIVISVSVLFYLSITYILLGAFTGNTAQGLSAVIQLSTIVLVVLFTPILFENIHSIVNEHGNFTIPVVHKDIPNPFYHIGAGLLEIGILVMLIYMAINRMISTLGSGGHG